MSDDPGTGRGDEPDVALDYELDDVIAVDTPERMKAVADPTRSLILDLVLERSMSVSDLAARIGRSKGTLAHHVLTLVDAGLLKVVRVRKVRAVEERFYGRVARTMAFPGHPSGELPFVNEAIAEADFALMADHYPSEFTLRHARIPRHRAVEWNRRMLDLALEFSSQPRSGDVEYALLVGLYPTNRPVAPRKRRGAKR